MEYLLANSQIVDISLKKYYELILPDYIELSKILREDGSKVSALRLFLENLESIRSAYDKITGLFF